MWTETPNVRTNLLSDLNHFITKMRAFLRKISIDEVPQVWDIIKADMSFVVHRAFLFTQEELIGGRDKVDENSMSIRLTGLLQVDSRYMLPIMLKIIYYGGYIKRMNFKLDIQLFLIKFMLCFE